MLDRHPSADIPMFEWGEGAGATLVIFPAMGIAARHYENFARGLVAQGFRVCVTDLRGQGDFAPAPSPSCDFGFAQLVDDATRAIRQVQQRHPEDAVVAVGHSLGGHIVTLLAGSLQTHALGGVVTLAADSPYYKAFGAQGWFHLAKSQSAALLSAVLGYFPGDVPGMGNIGRQARTLMFEWAHMARSGRYCVAELPSAEAAIQLAEVPVLAVSIDGDPIAPPRSVDHLAGKFAEKYVERKHYCGAFRKPSLRTHFAFIKEPEDLPQIIKEWWVSKSALEGPDSVYTRG